MTKKKGRKQSNIAVVMLKLIHSWFLDYVAQKQDFERTRVHNFNLESSQKCVTFIAEDDVWVKGGLSYERLNSLFLELVLLYLQTVKCLAWQKEK